MKHSIHILRGVALLSIMPLVAPLAQAQTTAIETTSSDTTSMGTISGFSPDLITVRTESAPAPVAYRYTKTTTYIDENGNPVSMETVKSGLPVTVYYTQVGGNMVASKVIVHKAVTVTPAAPTAVEEKTTTTTTTNAQ